MISKEKTILGSAVVLVILAVIVQYSGVLAPQVDSGELSSDGINVTLLTNAGIMIEVDEMRIYIDPIDLPAEYRDKPADAVLITHDHGDHYQYASMNMVQKEDTINVFPAIMDTEIARHDGMGVVPEDEFEIGDIKVTAYYMYTYSPVAETPASHPAESQYTSYIVDIEGFTIFHAGDSKNLDEYEDLTGTINVAMLPLGPGCQTMYEEEVVNVLQEIEPDYFIPIHFTRGANDRFVRSFRRSIESTTECEICNLDYYTTHTFQTEKVEG